MLVVYVSVFDQYVVAVPVYLYTAGYKTHVIRQILMHQWDMQLLWKKRFSEQSVSI